MLGANTVPTVIHSLRIDKYVKDGKESYADMDQEAQVMHDCQHGQVGVNGLSVCCIFHVIQSQVDTDQNLAYLKEQMKETRRFAIP